MINRVIGSYKILEKIGEGGMGVVYKAIHTKLDQLVAIKILFPQYSRDLKMQNKLVNEAKLQAKFAHPNVVNILNYFEQGEDSFLVMEFVDGETVSEILKTQTKIPESRAINICLDVLSALEFMHTRGLIHRDIKPSNIMISKDGLVKVTDFGIAKVMGDTVKTRTGLVGSLSYISPEQILGEEVKSFTDIYSLGISLYHMVTGRVPYIGDSEFKIMKGHIEDRPVPPWILNQKLDKNLSDIILKSIEKKPLDRFYDAAEFSNKLSDYFKRKNSRPVELAKFIKFPDLNGIKDTLTSNIKRPYLYSVSSILVLLIVFVVFNYLEIKPFSFNHQKDSDFMQSVLDNLYQISLADDIENDYFFSKLDPNKKKLKKKWRRKKKVQTVDVSSSVNIKGTSTGQSYFNSDKFNQKDEKADLQEILKRNKLLPVP